MILRKLNRTFNLPNFQDRVIQGSGIRGNVGTYKDESLPNITGSWAGIYNSIGLSGAVSGTFKHDGSQPKTTFTNDSAPESALFDINASRSSSTYQDSAPVQQNALLIQCCIKY